LDLVERTLVARGGDPWRAEVRGRIALQPLDHSNGRDVGGSLEPACRPPDGGRVARPVRDQRLQRRVLVAPAPAPPRPLHRPGEDSPLPQLEINLMLRRHLEALRGPRRILIELRPPNRAAPSARGRRGRRRPWPERSSFRGGPRPPRRTASARPGTRARVP